MPGKTKNPEKNPKFHHNSSQRINQQYDFASIHLSVGATLADLLRFSETAMANQAVLVDGVAPEEALPLHEGAVVTIVPQPRNAAGDEPWRATIPAFRDEALFQEYSDVLKARRRELSPDEEAQ